MDLAITVLALTGCPLAASIRVLLSRLQKRMNPAFKGKYVAIFFCNHLNEGEAIHRSDSKKL